MTIQKLQKRFYSRAEIAEIMELAPNDKSFANKVQTRLNNWGYKYHYSSKRVKIKQVPSTVEEKLRELLIRMQIPAHLTTHSAKSRSVFPDITERVSASADQ